MPLGLAYTSFAVRMLQGRDIMQSTAAALPAAAFVQLCIDAGAAGCQIDLSQIEAVDVVSLARLRTAIEAGGLFVELSIPSAALETRDAFDAMLAVARALGVSRARTALLMGRRYESFATMDDWRRFASRWRSTLTRIAPMVEDTGLIVGVENHKDWLATELRTLLDEVGSPSIGACLDFGNNLALLEDPEAVVDILAPRVVTTHVKDMAVRETADGFEMAEVPLGAGLLPLARMMATIRAVQPDARLVLEMITRDPLPVPIRHDRYWMTREPHERAAAEAFAASLMRQATNAAPTAIRTLPQTSGLSPEAAVALEDDHVRACLSYARHNPGL
jgi:sugar phosphate isomerase/epimerase